MDLQRLVHTVQCPDRGDIVMSEPAGDPDLLGRCGELAGTGDPDHDLPGQPEDRVLADPDHLRPGGAVSPAWAQAPANNGQYSSSPVLMGPRSWW